MSKIGEMASREASEAGALKAVRPERGRKGLMGGERNREMVLVTAAPWWKKSVDIRGKRFRFFRLLRPNSLLWG